MSLPADLPAFATLLAHVKQEIRGAQTRAARAATSELLLLYWRIGRLILEQQAQQGWGAKVIEQLATELQREFSGMQGLSARNLNYMRRFAQAYPEEAFVQVTLAQIPWYHHLTLLEKVKDESTRLLYIEATARHAWSRDVLVHQIESGYHHRQGQAVTNFARTLPAADSELAQQTLKDPYLFDFLTLAADYKERDLQRGLLRSYWNSAAASLMWGSRCHWWLAGRTTFWICSFTTCSCAPTWSLNSKSRSLNLNTLANSTSTWRQWTNNGDMHKMALRLGYSCVRAVTMW
jgi:predicted nuclease of restriction endonuclease-like (RecB) superfamily